MVHYRRKSESLNERWKKVVLTKSAHSATYSSILWFWELILFNSTLVIMYRPNNIYCSNKNLTATQGHLLFPLSRKASFFLSRSLILRPKSFWISVLKCVPTRRLLVRVNVYNFSYNIRLCCRSFDFDFRCYEV